MEITFKRTCIRIGYNTLEDPKIGYNCNDKVDFCHEISIGRLYICWTQKGEIKWKLQSLARFCFLRVSSSVSCLLIRREVGPGRA